MPPSRVGAKGRRMSSPAPEAPARERKRRQIDRSLAGLSSKILRPKRPQLRAVRAALDDLDDPLEAWERLATRGLIPDAWVTADHRTVAGAAVREQAAVYGRGGCAPMRRPLADASPRPASLAQCVALASDPEGVL